MKIVENRKIFFGISIAVIVLGLAFMVYNGCIKNIGIFNFGIEFKGGTVLTVNLDETATKTDVQKIIDEITHDKNAQLQKVVDKNQYIIKLSASENNAKPNETNKETEISNESSENANVEGTQKTVEEAIAEANAGRKTGDRDVDILYDAFKLKYKTAEIVELSDIAPTVGKEMAKNAAISVLFAGIAILIYVSYRFKDAKMGISSIIALLHDVLVVLAFYAIFRIPVGNSFIAAILTIVGYSINNTIVIFDRMRENLHLHRKLHKDILVNRSIGETLTRTINTSITTLLSIVALYVMGVDSIREFTLPLIVGIVVGTYSSVLIVGPLWFMLRKKKSNNAKSESAK